MTVEIITTGIEDLDENEPMGDDPLTETDDHIRNVKKALGLSFPALSAAPGGTDVSVAELNLIAGVTGNVQTQLDNKASRLWTFPERDSVSGSTETWLLQPSTLIMPRLTSGAIIECELPAISASTDGESIQIRPADRDIAPGVFLQMTAPGAEQFRLLTSTGAWINASNVTYVVPPWPHMMCIFSAHFGRWVVRSLNSNAGPFS